VVMSKRPPVRVINPVLCRASIGAERTESGGSEARDRSRPCGFDRNRWFRSLGSWLRQRLGIVGEALRSSVTCTITACALVYAAGRW
jgi:hypothetical protein